MSTYFDVGLMNFNSASVTVDSSLSFTAQVSLSWKRSGRLLLLLFCISVNYLLCKCLVYNLYHFDKYLYFPDNKFHL
jgi:hypothetical protein